MALHAHARSPGCAASARILSSTLLALMALLLSWPGATNVCSAAKQHLGGGGCAGHAWYSARLRESTQHNPHSPPRTNPPTSFSPATPPFPQVLPFLCRARCWGSRPCQPREASAALLDTTTTTTGSTAARSCLQTPLAMSCSMRLVMHTQVGGTGQSLCSACSCASHPVCFPMQTNLFAWQLQFLCPLRT